MSRCLDFISGNSVKVFYDINERTVIEQLFSKTHS